MEAIENGDKEIKWSEFSFIGKVTTIFAITVIVLSVVTGIGMIVTDEGK